MSRWTAARCLNVWVSAQPDRTARPEPRKDKRERRGSRTWGYLIGFGPSAGVLRRNRWRVFRRVTGFRAQSWRGLPSTRVGAQDASSDASRCDMESAYPRAWGTCAVIDARAIAAERMTKLLNVVVIIILVMIALALWRSVRENRSQPHVPLEKTVPR